MAQYSLPFEAARLPPGLTTNLPFAEFRTSATDQVRITEIALGVYTSTNGAKIAIGLGSPAVVGVPKPNSFSCVADDGGNNSLAPSVVLATEWTRLPTTPTRFIRRLTMTSEANAGLPPAVWKFSNLSLGASSSLVFWNLSQDANSLMFYGWIGFDA